MQQDHAQNLSRHALSRLQQRGISPRMLDFVRTHGDRDRPVGNGCTAVSISRARLQVLRRAGWPPAILERARKVTVIEGSAGAVVTVMHRHGRGARHYWRA